MAKKPWPATASRPPNRRVSIKENTGSGRLGVRIWTSAKHIVRCLFVNAVDDPAPASCFAAGVVRRAGVTFAISTAGVAPALAGLLRQGLEAVIPDDLARWVSEAHALRRAQKAAGVLMQERRPLLLRALNRLYRIDDSDK